MAQDHSLPGNQLQSIVKGSFGLLKNETLKLEDIIKSAFENPDRKKFKSNFGCKIYTHNKNETPEYLVQRILSEMPIAQTRFDAAQISVLDTSTFSEKSDFKGEVVDKEEYSRQIKTQRWFGPFKSGN